MLLSGNGHVACQIKDNDTYNNMQAIILSLHAPYTPRVGSKGQNSCFFLKVVMLHVSFIVQFASVYSTNIHSCSRDESKTCLRP